MTTIISRNSQLIHRVNDPFSPLKVNSNTNYNKSMLSYFEQGTKVIPIDEIFDGVSIKPKETAAIWEDENYVHRIMSISEKINSTRFLLGRQVIAIHDDIKSISYALAVEKGGLILISIENNKIKERKIIFSGFTQRAHLSVNKFTGQPYILHASRVDNDICLFLNNKKIETESADVDFPYMAFSQVPIGHIQSQNPEYALITYKCRKSGRLYIRDMREDTIEPERILDPTNTIGGIDFSINKEEVLFRVDCIEEDSLVTKIATSKNFGVTISKFTNLDISDYEAEAILPESSGIISDYLGNFHIPVTVLKNEKRHLLDVLSDDTIVTALELPNRGHGAFLAPFPKKEKVYEENKTLGRGNGFTDGIGIIATGINNGKLYSSNSQSGGILFPEARLLNHEMPKIFSFKPSDNCYTRGAKPNLVSMDYLFLESDDSGNPISNELYIDSWDMPLPLPVCSAVAKGKIIEMTIDLDGWFEEGKTTFNISDPSIKIMKVVLTSERTAKISCNQKISKNLKITFEMKNIFYWHRSSCKIKS